MKKIYLIIALLMIVVSSCKKDPAVNLKYVDVESETLSVSSSSAEFKCKYGYFETLDNAYLYYGKTSENQNFVAMKVIDYQLSVKINNLEPATAYYYHYEFDNGYNRMSSATKTFTTDSVHPSRPEVKTLDVEDITENTAVCGGKIISNGGAAIIECGVCWSQNPKPTLDDEHAEAEASNDEFRIKIVALQQGKTYYVRAYAKNEVGVSYGQDVKFTTAGPDIPEGAVNGLFSVAEGRQVYFSKGNLQYIGSASVPYWKFADQQYEYFGESTGQGSSNENVDRDLFCWATSGYDHGGSGFQPWSTDTGLDYYAYGHSTYDLSDSTGIADWGFNRIANGENEENQWRTLSGGEGGEWEYLMVLRETPSNVRYAKVRIDQYNGIIIFPDNWDVSYWDFASVNCPDVSFSSNIISMDDWTSIIEPLGVVFLPASGVRRYLSIDEVGTYADYWSSTHIGDYSAHDIDISDYKMLPCDTDTRRDGLSVRLVKDVAKNY